MKTVEFSNPTPPSEQLETSMSPIMAIAYLSTILLNVVKIVSIIRKMVPRGREEGEQ